MDTIIILDFGGQYCHLISRRIRDIGVCAAVLPADAKEEDLLRIPDLKGIILSGGSASVYDDSSPKCDKNILNLGVPILGICYGHQLIAYLESGEVIKGNFGEYGITVLKVMSQSQILNGLCSTEKVWMNHQDIVKKLPINYSIVASTMNSPVAVFENLQTKIYGVQFHPEVTHTQKGNKIFENFVLKICGAKRNWKISNIIANISNEIKEKIGKRKKQ